MKVIDNYVNDKIDKRLLALNLTSGNLASAYIDETYKASERIMFYYGDTEDIIKFYKTRQPQNYIYPLRNFYKEVSDSSKIPILHYPLSKIITKTMVNLVFSSTPTITVSSGAKTRDKAINASIEDIYKDNDIGKLLQNAGELESYSGAVAFKLVLDPEYTEYPIIQAYAKEDFDITLKYGRVDTITFRDNYCEGKYTLYSIYGKGYIDYKLYKFKYLYDKNRNYVREIDGELPLDTIPETANLHRIDFLDIYGEPSKDIYAVYKENKNNAESDYDNLVDDFAVIDEAYSNLADIIRKSSILTYIYQNQIKMNKTLNSSLSSNEIINSDYDRRVVVLKDSNPNGLAQKAERDTIDSSAMIAAYQSSMDNTILKALATAGLSPCSIGIDAAGANSSSLALNIRERVSMRTRAEKVLRWKEAIVKLTQLVYTLYTSEYIGENLYITPADFDVEVKFAEYESPSYEEKVDSLGKALTAKLIDSKSALIELYPDRSAEDIELMIANIKGSSPQPVELANPSTNPDLTVELGKLEASEPVEEVEV